LGLRKSPGTARDRRFIRTCTGDPAPGRTIRASAILWSHDVRARIFGARWDEMTHFPRIAFAVVILSIGVIAQTEHGNAPFCPLRPNDKNPFLRLISVEEPSRSTLQNGIDLTRVIPPQEFRRHRLIAVIAVSPKISIWPSESLLSPPDACDFAHINSLRSIH